jgi:vacuolar-type H+-ATPase subunit I/STV1
MPFDFLKKPLGDDLFAQVSTALEGSKLKLVDLSDGGYVDVEKYNSKVTALQSQVNTLQETVTTRDNDLKTLQTSLEAANTDAGKLKEVQSQFTALQEKYNTDKADFDKQLAGQAYQFAVKERVNAIKFSSESAKKAFMADVVAKDLKVDGDKLIGFDEFLADYEKADPTAFVKESPAPTEPPVQNNSNHYIPPVIVQPTKPSPTPGEGNPFSFNFPGVRQMPKSN